jgi:hypothetical protein
VFTLAKRFDDDGEVEETEKEDIEFPEAGEDSAVGKLVLELLQRFAMILAGMPSAIKRGKGQLSPDCRLMRARGIQSERSQ